MAETQEAPVQVSAEQKPQEQQQQQTAFNPFAQDAWSESLPEPTKVVEQPKPEGEVKVEPAASTPASDEEIIDENDFFTREFGKAKEDFKKEYEELRKFREQQPKEETWANEDSKKVHGLLREGKIDEVINIYNKQKQIEKYTNSEVNPQTAEDILKLQMKLKYEAQGLTDDEIDFQYRQNYGIPKEPVYNELKETEEDFAERHANWKEQVANIEKRRTIDAKMAIPELQKLKTEIKFPELSQPQVQQPSQESLEAARIARENFLQKLESDYTKVEGFNTKVKDESVELAISHKIPDEVKAAIKGRLSEGMDINEYMDKRWFDEKGNANINQIMLDIYQLENLDKILSSVANNASSTRLAEYIKASKNLSVNNGTPQQTFQPSNGTQNVSPFSKDAWTENVPIRN